MTRGKGEGSIFKDSRGLWTAVIELPPAPNGTRRRKTIRSKDKKVVASQMRELQRERDRTGDLQTAYMTVEQWVTYWFENIALKKIKPKTASTYRSLITREIIPAIGSKKLDKLTPDDVRKLENSIRGKGLSTTTALQAHRILGRALKVAEREGKIPRNVTTLTDAPARAVPQLQALSVEEAIRVLEYAATIPNGSLVWAILLTGARQGELLGLRRAYVTDALELAWQLQRFSWEHGCGGRCGRTRGTDCPQRRVTLPDDSESFNLQGSLWMSRPKSKTGWRIIPLVEPLRAMLLNHIEETSDQANPHDLVWHQPNGHPIDPRRESTWWHDVLREAGVKQVRLHDGRHTTVDLLLAAGVPEDIIAEIVGHSTWMQVRAYKSRRNRERLEGAMNTLADFVAKQRPESRLDNIA